MVTSWGAMVFSMAGNTPTISTATQAVTDTPKSSALSKTVAAIALALSLALSGGAEAATSPEITTLSEEYQTCIAGTAETTKKFRAALEKKQSEGADTKNLEVRMKKILDDTNEGCAKIASADAKIASADAKIASADAEIASNRAETASSRAAIASADAKIASNRAETASADAKIQKLNQV